MSSRPKIKDKIQQELKIHGNNPKNITKLILDGCSGPFEGLSAEFSELEQLSLNNVGLTSLKDFPHLPKLKKVNRVVDDLFVALFFVCVEAQAFFVFKDKPF
jgi:Leucine-rich repeat (LRR) protein